MPKVIYFIVIITTFLIQISGLTLITKHTFDFTTKSKWLLLPCFLVINIAFTFLCSDSSKKEYFKIKNGNLNIYSTKLYETAIRKTNC